MSEGELLAAAALDLVGSPYRLHGRDPNSGLDCVGLLAACLQSIGRTPKVPHGYALRNRSVDKWLGCADRSGLMPIARPERAGDVILSQPAAGQHHILILVRPGLAVHAHASLRRVVVQAVDCSGSTVLAWRLNQTLEG